MNPRSSWTICATRVCERPSRVDRREKRDPVTSVTGKVTEVDATGTTGTGSCSVASAACAIGIAATQTRPINAASRGRTRFNRHRNLSWRVKRPAPGHEWHMQQRGALACSDTSRLDQKERCESSTHGRIANLTCLQQRLLARATVPKSQSTGRRLSKRKVLWQVERIDRFCHLLAMICVQRDNVLNKLASFVVSSLQSAPYTKIRVADLGRHCDD